MQETVNVLLSLATNYDHEAHLSEVRKRLGQVLSGMVFTESCMTTALDAEGRPHPERRPYLNQIVMATTTMDYDELNQWLKTTEAAMGRNGQKRARGMVPIDIDILLYDGFRHHEADWERSYIKDLLRKSGIIPATKTDL